MQKLNSNLLTVLQINIINGGNTHLISLLAYSASSLDVIALLYPRE